MDYRSKDRVKNLGEVFTPPKIANDMLDMIDQEKLLRDKFLEPTCGNGNIFIEAFKRRLDLALVEYLKEYEKEKAIRWSIAYVAATSFAADIMMDNVIETRLRAKKLIESWFNDKMGVPCIHVLSSFAPVFDEIDRNVQCADALAGLCDNEEDAMIAAQKTKASRDFFNKNGWIKIYLGE